MTDATHEYYYTGNTASRAKGRIGSATFRRAETRDLLPTHRLTVIAKTPLLVALGLYMAGGHFAWATVGITLLLSSLLWGILYAVNEAFDLALERRFAVPRITIFGLIVAVLTICGAGFAVAPKLGVLFTLMTAGQIAYCAPPLRLKRWWGSVLLLSGIVNPLFRAYCGAIWGAAPLPALAILAIVLLHLGSTIRTRALQRDRDRRLQYRVSPHTIDKLGAVSIALGILDCAYLCAVNVFPRVFLFSGPFVIGFALYAWSDKAKSMKRVRRGWILFAVGAMFGLFVLLRGQ